ncbi:MAG: trimethylamine methyltransferase family protein [Thiolinea sp.]
MSKPAVATQTQTPPRRKRTKRTTQGGRAARIAQRKQNHRQLSTGITQRQLPTLDILNEEALAAIETQADWILKEIGIEFRGDEEALRLFKAAGADVQGERIRFEPGHARQLCRTAPASFRMESRNPAHSIILGGKHVVLMPGYGSPFVTDLKQGRRYATLQDFHNFVKLSYQSPHLHHGSGTVVEPVDIPVNKRHLDMVYAHLRYSTKPFMGGVTAPERAQDSIDMAKIVFGADYLEQHCVIQGNINVNSPLVYDHTMSGALRTYARAGQSVAVSPAIFAGAMSPVSQAAVLAQTHAEAMVGIALSQLVRPGTPVVYGNFNTTMNLKSGALTFGSPEANLSYFAFAQLGRRLGVPVRSGGGQITASNTADAQAMQESTASMMTAILSGSNMIYHSAGWLEGGLSMGYEKFMMDLDHCGMVLRLLQGIEVDAEALGQDAYREIRPGGNFLSTSHTLRHFANANYESLLGDAGAYEQWLEQGSQTLEQRAQQLWQQKLAEYEAPDIDPAVDEELLAFIQRRKNSMADEWY